MRALIRRYTTIALSLWLLFIAGATVRADIYLYGRRDDGGPPALMDIIRTGKDGAGGGDVAVMCEAGSGCFEIGSGGISCIGCHAQAAPSFANYTSQQNQVHLTRYFPMIEMRLGEGQETTFARQKLRREGGRLIFVDPKGGKRPLPVGAMLLKNNSGRPFAIVSSNPPQ